MASGKNPTNGNGDKWIPSRIDAPFEILQIQELSLGDLKVLLYLYSRDLKKKGKAWPGRKTIIKDTGYSERCVSRSISNLSALGIVRRDGSRRGSATVYYLKYGDELMAAINAIPALAKKARENGRQIRKVGGGKGDKPVTLYSDKGCQTRSQDTPQTRASTGFARDEYINEYIKEGIKGIVEEPHKPPSKRGRRKHTTHPRAGGEFNLTGDNP